MPDYKRGFPVTLDIACAEEPVGKQAASLVGIIGDMDVTTALLVIGAILGVNSGSAITDVINDRHHPRVRRNVGPLPKEEQDKQFWNKKAQEELWRNLQISENRNIAKNVILFLGDGLSIPTISAARVYKGQLTGLSGEETTLHFENFPYSGLSRTYCVDAQVADSACSATAYLGGVKGNTGTIGVTAAVRRQDCNASADAGTHVNSIAAWAQNAGKATGLVTTTRVTHASPAGIYAHVSERNWEDDNAVIGDKKNPITCPDIAQQLIHSQTGSRLNVIMGGGRRFFYPKEVNEKKGTRRDRQNLIDTWESQKQLWNSTYAYVTSRSELLSTSPSVDYLLGLFTPCHMNYQLEKGNNEPSLEEMTIAAINTLNKSQNGFFLFVEGGRIDHAHHDNMAMKSLDETVEFAKAIQAADKMTDDEDTLIVVTADHAHVMSYSGYALRGNNILGFGGDGNDGLPYSTLNYANGPGYVPPERCSKRPDLRKLNREQKLYKFPAMVPLSSETHGGDDVAVFARGPWSHLFTGSYEQNYIPHAMAYASCIGSGLTACAT